MRSEIADSLVESRLELAQWVTHQFFEKRPQMKARWGPVGFKRCSEDAAFHLAYLAEAIRFDFPILFIDYLGWTKILLHALNIPDESLQDNLAIIQKGVEKRLSAEASAVAGKLLGEAIELLPSLPTEIPSYIKAGTPHAEAAAEWIRLLLQHNPRDARRLVFELVEQGAKLTELYQHLFTPGLHEVGRLWQMRKITEADEHYCSQMTQTTLAVLSSKFTPIRIHKSVVGFSVGSELHEIGIRVITDCFAQHGWDAVCLGSNVPTRNMYSILRDWSPDVVAISVTMTYHLAEAQAAVAAIRKADTGKRPRIIVGGRPFNLCPDLGPKIGADATAQSCAELLTCAA